MNYKTLDQHGESEGVLVAAGQDSTTRLQEFLITHKLGQGSFGNVYLAELRDRPEEKYAIKSIRKDRLIEKSAV